MIVPSAPTLPVNPLNGAAKLSEQFVSVTTTFMPTSDASQCWLTVHAPEMSGHAASLVPAVGLPGVPDESEPHEHARKPTANNVFLIRVILTASPP